MEAEHSPFSERKICECAFFPVDLWASRVSMSSLGRTNSHNEEFDFVGCGFKDAATSSVGGAVVEEATGFSSSSCKSELLVLACCCCCSWVLGDCCAQLD